MHIPKGKPVHERLSTSYVNVEALLADLQTENFTGYVFVGFPAVEGYVLFNGGQVVNGVEQTETALKVGNDALKGILTRSHQRGGIVSIYTHPREIIQAICGIIEGYPVYKDLTSDFASLERLVLKLSKEQSLTWYIDVSLGKNEGGSLIYIINGKVEAILSMRDGLTVAGENGLRETFSRSEQQGATFSVYRSSEQTRPLPVNPPQQVTAAPLPPVVPTAPPPPVVPTAPSPAPAVSYSGGPAISSMPKPVQDKVIIPRVNDAQANNSFFIPPAEVPEIEIIDIGQEEEIVSLSEAEPSSFYVADTHSARQTQPVSTPEEFSELIRIMSDVVSNVERAAVGSIAENGDFSTALREGLLEVTDQYPFLDPFAAEFEYNFGEIVFVGTANPAEFVAGLTDALRHAVNTLTQRRADRDLRNRVAQRLRKLYELRREEFDRYGLDAVLERITTG